MVITGLGVVSPLGTGISAYWNNLLKNKSPLKKISLFTTKEFNCKYAFQINKFNFSKYFRDLKSEYVPRSTKFLLSAAVMALTDAHLKGGDFYRSDDVGVFTSTIYGSSESSCQFHLKILLHGSDSVSPMAFPASLINYSSNYLSILNNFQGPNVTFASGFQAGLEAINFGAHLIKQGVIKAALVSGLNDLCVYTYAQLSLKRLLFEPECKSAYKAGIFDGIRNGMLLGENASAIILEDMDSAKKRQARIYAQVSGYSANFGKDQTSYAKVINGAINNSGLSAEDIGLCMLNANGIKSIDTKELNAVKSIFKDNLDKINFSAIKENNGECEGASTPLQALTAAKIIYSGIIPPAVYRFTNSGLLARNKISFKPERAKRTNILINSFNIEGNNAALIIKQFN